VKKGHKVILLYAGVFGGREWGGNYRQFVDGRMRIKKEDLK
jgi:hypothetical protein